MSVIGDFTVPASEFVLADALASVPEMTVRGDQMATHSTMGVFPFLWASGGDFEAFGRALRADPTVEDVTVVEETGDAVLYKFGWSESFTELIDDVANHHAAVVDARGRDGRWRLKLRFVEDHQVSTFRTHFAETGHSFEVLRIYHPTEARQREFDLTAEQYETLLAALEDGYFEVPRGTSVEELGDRLGVSANAASQRLRRGCQSLLENTVTIEGADRGRDAGDEGDAVPGTDAGSTEPPV
ncbi:helix-turn-helix domain-containing protein [Halorarum salinum]|uniref:Helix-turn-helix domain-containing protein n=1 Tax=Halorarum salinum TaxID=2743089 RepID=A0A7D5LCP1_9EURY|nr:bacterio-opsin activator domain-containing protein [Halobaculum salinum]QLG63388.1 helix-turn-helix domain-containing protein [Halobaculum salinum]